MIEEKYDVVVVGAGPAGSFAAKRCAEHGLNVLVLDRNQEIGCPKRCGEGLSESIEKRFGFKIPDYCISQTINGAHVYAPNGKCVELNFGSGYVLERKQFDKWLACEASRSGANVVAKSYVYNIMKSDNYVNGVEASVVGENLKIKSRIVVAADGVESVIAKKAGINTTCSPFLVDSGFQYEMSNIKLNDEHKIRIFLGNEIAKRGYCWIFPKGKDRANVGVGIRGDDPKTAKHYLDKFVNSIDELKNSSIVEVNGGAVPVGGFLKNMVTNGLIVIGDAAHQVNPLHGGGISEAMISADIATSVIKKAFDKNDFTVKILNDYNKIWWKERGNKLKMVERVREAVEKLSDKQLNDLADILSGENIYDIVHGNFFKLGRVLIKFGLKSLV